MSRPPDASDPPPGVLLRKAQYIMQLLGGDMSPEEYRERLSLLHSELEDIYWLGYSISAAKDVFRRPTVKPPPVPDEAYPEIEVTDIIEDDG